YTISGVHILFEDDFSTDMGWTGYGSGGWTRGSAVASAGCSGSQDPSLDNTPTADNFIIGNYLGACYPNSMASTYWLTSPVIDCSGMINCAIDMWSHSGCESNSFDHMYIDVYNGVTWSNVFSNSGSYSESTWTNLNYNVSAAADNNPNFRVRFGMGSTDGSVTYKGWNIDDFKITGIGDVNVIDTLCDFTTTQNTVVFAAPNPDFTFVDSVCVYSNTTIQYTGNASAGANYSWNFSGGTIVSGSGQGPFQVYWTSANTYALTLSVDENGCINDTTFYITVLPANSPFCCVLPTPDAGPADSTCSLSYTMQAAASGIPGAWVVSSGPAGSTANFANATANNSAVTVDTYGVYVFSWTEGYSPTCSASDSVMIAFYPDPVFDFTNINLLCNNICQGSITVNPLGTTDLPYSYLWDSNAGNQTSVTATNLCAGPFTVTVTNVHGCTDFSSSTLTEPPLLTASAVISSNYNGEDVSCYGSTDGSANLTVTGGTTNYSYSWTGPAGFTSAIEDISGIGAGTYNVVVTDANLCTATSGVTLTQPTQVSVSTSMTQVSCFGYSDGTATATPSGGTGVISYLWNDLSSQTTPTATGLAGGPYNIVVTDANGCTAGGSITVTQPASPVSLTISGTQNISCFNGSDGYVNITVAGGSGGFTYNWDSGQTSEDLNNVQAGTYCVVASDMFGCSVSDCATLTEPTQLLSSISSVDASCYGGHDGSVSVTASGGTQPYFYNWSNGMSGPSIMNVESGNYSVIVTDNNGCTTSNSAVVEEPSEIVISASSDIWICIGQTTQLNAAAVGGSPGYTFTWSTGTQASSISVSPTVTQQYSVQAEDAIGCYSNTDYVTVFVYKPITVEVSISETEICPGDPVFIYANATGGNGNYTYALTGGQQIWPPYTDYPSESTSYTVTASDNCGSPTDQGTVNVEVMPLPPISFAPDTVQGCEPLTVHFIENSPDVGQNYVWDFDDPNSYNTSSKKNPTHTFEYDGVYDITLTVTSADGCVITDVVEDLITVWPRPEAGFIPDPDVASVIKPIIFFQNTSNGGFDYHWMFGDGDSSLTIHPYHTYASVPGTYLVELIVTSDKGCRDTIYDEVMIRDEYTFYAPNAFSPDGNGQNDRFFVTGHGIDEGEFLLIIYDRWGEEIYKSEDISEGWDGKAKNGNKECKVGTYTWLAVFKDFQGIEHQETGMVTIIR
ncbi:MAG: PKD domain-containing protein, partial [Bacteroidota bacterium]